MLLELDGYYKTFKCPSSEAGKETVAYVLNHLTEEQVKKYSQLIRKDEGKNVHYFTREDYHRLNSSNPEFVVDFLRNILFGRLLLNIMAANYMSRNRQQ
jgi:hypothetical protein